MKTTLFIFLIIYLLLVSLTGNRNIFNYIEMKRQFSLIKKEIILFDKEILSLNHQINLIEIKDKDYVDFLNQKRKVK